MRYVVIGVIRIYWVLWPRDRNRLCLFRETCSHYVHRIAREYGAWRAMRALLERMRQCRPGYSVATRHGAIGLLLRDGAFLPGAAASPHMIAEAASELAVLCERADADEPTVYALRAT